jgi:putative restriction endonuclease
LYRIEEYWHEPGASGFEVWRFRLIKDHSTTAIEPAGPDASTPSGTKQTRRAKTTVSRVIRDTSISRDVKKIHDFTCQVCGTRLEGPAGGYAEGAHIRPLGQPHNGPDTTDNILCLCPNHHWLFDCGAFGINDDFKLFGLAGELRTTPKHTIDVDHLTYHRNHFGFVTKA